MVVEFIGAVAGALAVAAPVVKNLGDIAQGVQRMRGVAADILGRFARKVPRQTDDALSRAVVEAAALPPAEFDKKVEEVVELVLADEPADKRSDITEMIKLVAPRIRANFARPDDPTGTTAPARWAANRPEDLVPFLPPRPPLFRRGDFAPDYGNRWTLVERLGIGSFGEVWKARNNEDDFSVFKFCLDPESQQRMFTHERKIIRLVKKELDDHKNIVKLMESHLDGPTPWLQYEYAPGGDLLHQFATWPRDLAARATMAVEKLLVLADTMAECHALRPDAVIHRDLKPANIVIGKRGDYKITDFGIGDTTARQALEEARIATATGVTTTSSMVRCFNTPLYASPDQKKGLDPHPADDVHALGVMLYQFVQNNVGLELGIDMWNDLESQHVCPQLLAVLDRCVASRVERRYQHAGELADALRSLPQKLITPPEVIVFDPEAERRAEREQFLRRHAEATAANEQARRHLDRREWQAAVAVLESIFHPELRDADLYARATAFLTGKRFVNALGMEFAIVPQGTFWMGGADGKCGDKQVTVPHDFYLGVYPVTQEEWQKVFPGDTPSHFRKGGGGADKLTGISDADLKRFPVESVSWERCNQFIRALNEKLQETGWMYRLPREAEWEYACRGGGTSQADCAWSYYLKSPTNTLSAQQANFADSALQRTSKVGWYEPNALGIYDLHGNVWEWCEDAYDGSDRVIRGGGWNDAAEGCRAAYRSRSAPSSSSSYLGLRLARVPVGSK